MTITEIQLPTDEERRDRNYDEVNKIVDSLNNLSIFPSLVWVWCWDVIRNVYESNPADAPDFVDEAIKPGVTLKQVWDKFWEDADKNGFSLEYGSEDLYEATLDWMRDSEFLISLEEE